MKNSVLFKENNLRLTAMYLKINDEGRNALDLITQKLVELPQVHKKADNTMVPIQRTRKSFKEI